MALKLREYEDKARQLAERLSNMTPSRRRSGDWELVKELLDAAVRGGWSGGTTPYFRVVKGPDGSLTIQKPSGSKELDG